MSVKLIPLRRLHHDGVTIAIYRTKRIILSTETVGSSSTVIQQPELGMNVLFSRNVSNIYMIYRFKKLLPIMGTVEDLRIAFSGRKGSGRIFHCIMIILARGVSAEVNLNMINEPTVLFMLMIKLFILKKNWNGG